MVPFYAIVGARAIEETRSVVVDAFGQLPTDSYAFMEFYCTDRKCDCRRTHP